MHSKWFSLILPLVALACLAWGQGLEPYCNRNETHQTMEEVVKTRVKEKSSLLGLRRKKVTETYTEQVPKTIVKVVQECCAGFKMSRLRLCEPVCLAGCPPHATCVEPNKCQCARDYMASVSPVDGSHSCTPFCEHPCPANSHCVEPNKCHCTKGYALTEQHQCEPVCHSGCSNGGKCIAPGICECEDGTRGHTCESADATDTPVTTADPFNGDDESTSSEEEEDGDDESVGDDQSDEDGEGDDFVSSVETATDKALPREFASYEFDCRHGPCPENSECLTNGTCVCLGGYWTYENSKVAVDGEGEESTSTSPQEEEEESTSVSPVQQRLPICVKSFTVLEAEEKTGDAKASNGGSEDSTWTRAFFIALGLTCMACAAVVLAVKLMRHRQNRMDVEAKNDIRCVYDSREDSEPPMVY